MAEVPAPTSRPDQSVIHQSHLLIARFLSSQGYTETLKSFKREAADIFGSDVAVGVDADDVELPKGANGGSDLREIVAEYLASKMQKLKLAPEPIGDALRALEIGPLPIKVTVRDSTNVLTVRAGIYPERKWDSEQGRFTSHHQRCIFTSSVDRTLKVYSYPALDLLATYPSPSPILSICVHPVHPRLILLATMEGTLLLLDLVTRDVVQKLRDHTKYLVKAAWSSDGRWVATVGYDKQLLIYEAIETPLTAAEKADAPALLEGEEPDDLAVKPKIELVLRKTVVTKTNPEAVVFLPSGKFVVWSVRDDHKLRYLRLPGKAGPAPSKDEWATTEINLNENGDAWVSFSVLSISVHPTLPVLALQTSTENARILLYPFHSSDRLATLFTTAAQSDYSTPRHTWLPDGSGMVVTSEDGILRVVDLRGKVTRIGAHGVPGGEGERSTSGVIKDVVVLTGSGEDEGLSFVSVGFDKTVRRLN